MIFGRLLTSVSEIFDVLDTFCRRKYGRLDVIRTFLRVNLELHKPVGGGRGAEVERRRREIIEAPKGVGPPPQKKFLILGLNIVSFGAFWVVFFTVQLPVLQAKRYNLVPFPIISILFFRCLVTEKRIRWAVDVY